MPHYDIEKVLSVKLLTASVGPHTSLDEFVRFEIVKVELDGRSFIFRTSEAGKEYFNVPNQLVY